MNTAIERPVVVGYDGSTSASAALDVGAAEALARGVSLRVVHAYVWPILYSSLANVPYHAPDWAPAPSTVAMLERLAERLLADHPGLAVTTSVVAGGGGPVLSEASNEASLLVVGGRGIGGIAGVLAGSVAPFVASHARCPVLVVRNGQTMGTVGGRVVVGVDGTPSSVNALRFAVDWAARSGASVEVLHALPRGVVDEPDPERGDATPARARVDDWLRGVRDEHPGVVIGVSIVRQEAGTALQQASGSARLIVVGSRGRGELASLTLGSVGMGLIRHALCPVAVVHGTLVGPAAQSPVASLHGTPPS